MTDDDTGTTLATFATLADSLVHGPNGHTAYSYSLDQAAGNAPIIDLGSDAPYSYTDCSGWVNDALNSVAPLQQAMLSAERTLPLFNQKIAYDGGTATLAEAAEPFDRAFVLSYAFANAPMVGATGSPSPGYAQVADFGALQAGDVIAYATGFYSDLSDPSRLPYSSDTGHTMIVTGEQAVARDDWYDGRHGDQLEAFDVAHVYAVSVVDSSDLPHMGAVDGTAADDRDYATADDADAPVTVDPAQTHAGGLGTGTIWFATDADGKAIAFKFNLDDNWHPTGGQGVQITAGRLTGTVDLSSVPKSALVQGRLEVTLLAGRSESLGGQGLSVRTTVTGDGGLLVDGTGTLTLSGDNDFTGGVMLDGTGLVLDGAHAAGSGAIVTEIGAAGTLDARDAAVTVASLGNDTVSAGGGSQVTASDRLHFTGLGACTVSGGAAASLTVSGGAGGLYRGGGAGHNVLTGGGGSSLWGGGAGDVITGGRGDLIGAAAGNTTLLGGTDGVLVDNDSTLAFSGQGATVFGARSGSDVIVGTGAFTAVGGEAHTTVFGGTGTARVWAEASHLTDVAGQGAATLVPGSGHADLWIGATSGAQTIEVVAGAGGGSVTVLGFRSGTDRVAFSGYATAPARSVHDGSLVLTLADHTSITFVGVTALG